MINDKNRLDSLCKFYFWWYSNWNLDFESLVKIASQRAYLDLCRTLEWAWSIKNKNIRSEVADILEIWIENLFKVKNQIDFNKAHDKICEEIINKYIDSWYNDFNYWHAQKWLNMTLKYLLILDFSDEIYGLKEIYEFMHVPLDWIIKDILIEWEYINKVDFEIPWSKLEKSDYTKIQEKALATIEKNKNKNIKSLMDIEFKLWHK